MYQNLNIVYKEKKSEIIVSEILILSRSSNQGSIILVYNLVFNSKIKYIDIQYNYICNKVLSQKYQVDLFLNR